MLVYAILNKVNRKLYVGQTSQVLALRWNTHISRARRGKKHPLSCAIRKYGVDSFEVFELYGPGLGREQASAIEILLIAACRSREREFGYNLSVGGEASALGSKRTEESLENYRRGHAGKHGYLRIANCGRFRSLEYRKKQRLAHLGRKDTLEQRLRKSKSSRARVLTDEQRVKYAEAGRKSGQVRRSHGMVQEAEKSGNVAASR